MAKPASALATPPADSKKPAFKDQLFSTQAKIGKLYRLKEKDEKEGPYQDHLSGRQYIEEKFNFEEIVKKGLLDKLPDQLELDSKILDPAKVSELKAAFTEDMKEIDTALKDHGAQIFSADENGDFTTVKADEFTNACKATKTLAKIGALKSELSGQETKLNESIKDLKAQLEKKVAATEDEEEKRKEPIKAQIKTAEDEIAKIKQQKEALDNFEKHVKTTIDGLPDKILKTIEETPVQTTLPHPSDPRKSPIQSGTLMEMIKNHTLANLESNGVTMSAKKGVQQERKFTTGTSDSIMAGTYHADSYGDWQTASTLKKAGIFIASLAGIGLLYFAVNWKKKDEIWNEYIITEDHRVKVFVNPDGSDKEYKLQIDNMLATYQSLHPEQAKLENMNFGPIVPIRWIELFADEAARRGLTITLSKECEDKLKAAHRYSEVCEKLYKKDRLKPGEVSGGLATISAEDKKDIDDKKDVVAEPVIAPRIGGKA